MSAHVCKFCGEAVRWVTLKGRRTLRNFDDSPHRCEGHINYWKQRHTRAAHLRQQARKFDHVTKGDD